MKLTPKVKAEDDGPLQGMLFEEWALAKYREISANINPCDANGKLDPQRLNEVLTKFAQHFAWAVTVQEVESNKLNRVNHEYDNWYKKRYNNAFRIIREEAGGQGRPPGQVTIEARIAQIDEADMAVKQEEIRQQKSRVDLLKGFVRVLDKQASILQTLSSNMRSEMFFAAGVPAIGTGKMTDAQRNNVAKTLLNKAMKGQGCEERSPRE